MCGRKVSSEFEARIQVRFDELLSAGPPPPAERVVRRHDEAVRRHVDDVATSIAPRDLVGLRVVVDCANGAAATVAPLVFARLGCDTHVIHDRPDGRNINAASGATAPEALSVAVVEQGADLGVAFDGDADRVIAVDHAGAVVDGDPIIGICAVDRKRRGILRDDTVVVTVMTNLGFRRGMDAAGITVVETPVGDRHVLEVLDSRGLTLGGEQSGHVIFRDLATTGDGILSAVQLLDVVARTGTRLADLAAATMTRLPQMLCNVATATRPPDLHDRLAPLIARAEAGRGDRGRILVRPSGTEPLVRVMVEAETDDEARATAEGLAAEVASLLG